MRIVFFGNSNSGKTTLAERVSVELELPMHYTNLSEVFQTNTKHIGIEKLQRQDEIKEKLFKTYKNNTDGCFDRHFIDVYCYSQSIIHKCLSNLEWEYYNTTEYKKDLNYAEKHLKWLEWVCYNSINTNDLFFYVEPLENIIEVEGQAQKVRMGEKDLHLLETYAIMYNKLFETQKNFFKVASSGLEERVDFVIQKYMLHNILVRNLI